MEDRDTRLLACESFLRSGGTRAEFERAWPGIVSDVSQGRR